MGSFQGVLVSQLDKLLHYLTDATLSVDCSRVWCFSLPGSGESLLSSEGSDPGLTPRRYYFSVRALRPKSCQHIFYPFAHTIYFPTLLLFSLERLSHCFLSPPCTQKWHQCFVCECVSACVCTCVCVWEHTTSLEPFMLRVMIIFNQSQDPICSCHFFAHSVHWVITSNNGIWANKIIPANNVTIWEFFTLIKPITSP